MSIENGCVFVPQRKYALLAPDIDPNVKVAATWGMGPCFAMAIGDRQNKVGLFTHLDYIEHFVPQFKSVVEDLKRLGARNVEVEVVNLGKFSQKRTPILQEMIDYLRASRLSEQQTFKSYGQGSLAIFDPSAGLMPASEPGMRKTLGFMPQPTHQELMRSLEDLPNYVECVYQPNSFK